MTRKRIGWGGGVWIIYGAFVVFILGCVAFASMQRFDLVAPNYYEQQIGFQQQIDKMAKTRELSAQPMLKYRPDDQTLLVTFPDFVIPDQVEGTIRLFRPSNSSWDRAIPIALDSASVQIIPADKLAHGLWKVKLDWQSGGESYYQEESVIIE